MMMNQLITKLSKPSHVASILDWKKLHGSTVLSLNFHQNRVGIAVASHPSTGQPVTELEPLNFAKNHIAIDQQCLERFSNIIDEHKVCAVVVSWPLQHDTGRMGAACGRVIYALEQLWQQANSSSSNNNHVLSRPFCLWDSDHVIPKQRQDPAKRVDAFGRCASYGTHAHAPQHHQQHQQQQKENENSNGDPTGSTLYQQHDAKRRQEYFARKERYHEDEMTVVCSVWNDFCKEHWPELYATSFSEPDALHASTMGRHAKQNDNDDQTGVVKTTQGTSKEVPGSSDAYGT
jgi:RNase H-fold protein (predicted Holliday junction resolvase)